MNLNLRERVAAAWELTNIERLRGEGALTRRLVRKTQDGTLGKSEGGEDEMPGDISIGDTHNYPAQPAKGMGPLATALIAGAVGIGTGGLGFGLAPLLTGLATKAPAVLPAVQPAVQPVVQPAKPVDPAVTVEDETLRLAK